MKIAGSVLFFLVWILSDNAAGQSPAFIHAALKDRETNRSVEYASAAITNTTLGTAADGNGVFYLRVDALNRKERLRISCIGYSTRMLSIDSLLSLQTDSVVIYLNPDRSLLDEVVVSTAPVDPAEIIRSAINAVSRNYLQRPFNLEMFSTIDANDSLLGKPFRVESCLLGYYNGYNDAERKKFEILHKRTTGDDPLVSVKYGYWPSFEVGAADLLTDPFKRGVLNPEFHSQFRFRYAGVSIYEEDTVYNIEYFAPKPTTKLTGYGIVPKSYKGNIYITTSTHAIVRHEIVTSSFSYHVIYKKHNGYYFPYYFSGLRANEFKLPGGKRPFITKNVVIVTRIITDDVKVIDSKANEFDIHKVKYDEAFWGQFRP